jgi:nicotinamidase-related amidase
MAQNLRLMKEQSALLVIDVQDRLYRQVDRGTEVLDQMMKVLKGFLVLQIPIIVTEQYPEGLGQTISELRELLGDQQHYFPKTSFSCLGDPTIKAHIESLPVSQWVLVGVEAHVCVLQTARDLLAANKQVIVINDAITSRSVYDFSSAIAELRDMGARISSMETVLFELVADARSTDFKRIIQIVK